jgi:hypothetical protein
MSGCSDSKPCPVCGQDMDVYTDYKPFDTVNMNCIHCGFYGYVKCGMDCDEDRQASWDAAGLDMADFEPLSDTDRKEYLEIFKTLCGPGELSACEESEYLNLPIPSGNSKRDQVKDILAGLLIQAGISETTAYEKAAECADRVFDALDISPMEQDMPASNINQVLISVRGGVAYVEHTPPGIEVEIVDYDNRDETKERLVS